MTANGGHFHAMTEATAAHWQVIAEGDMAYARDLPDRMLTHLEMLADSRHGFAVDRLGHCLQSATRALEDGRDEEYAVCALLHDIGDAFAPADHGDYAALVLRPFVSERNHWMIRHHGIFQGYYFNHHFGNDRDAREALRDHVWFDYTAEFCELYDQCAFDPGYRSLGLADVTPMLRRVLRFA